MDKNYFEDKIFEKKDFSEHALNKGFYENCRFIDCNFSNTSLAEFNFSECSFSGCNLSMATLTKTVFGDVQFKECKLMGLHFEDCNQVPFIASFEDCVLNFSSFYKVKIKKFIFKKSTIREVDFTDADLCDLTKSKFENTNLEKADLRTASNYSINPEINKIKKAKFSVPGVIGLLDKYDIEISH